jgi:predicted helicase
VQTTSGSFDSGERLSSLSSAQDDKLMGDVDVFRALVAAGRRLAEIHVNYEKQPEYQLTKNEKPGEKLDWRVTRMRLSKDKTTLIYNDLITLSGIPPETYEYRLGNRSALEWVIDQYQVSAESGRALRTIPTVPMIRNTSCA